MAKKKEEKEDTIYDWTIPFNALNCPKMFKAGLKEYIVSRDLKIKSDKEFNKIVKDYANLKI